MLGPTRPVPRVGGEVQIKHFGGTVEAGVVLAIGDGGRYLSVRAADGALHEFSLNPANARFASLDSAHGPRLQISASPRAES